MNKRKKRNNPLLVTVRKKASERIGIRFLTAFVILACVIFTLYFNISFGVFSLTLFPCIICFLFILFYFESWQISFSTDKVTKKVFSFKRTYPYAKVRSVTIDYYSSMHSCVMKIEFFKNNNTNKTSTMFFRLSDENADKAAKILVKRCKVVRNGHSLTSNAMYHGIASRRPLTVLPRSSATMTAER